MVDVSSTDVLLGTDGASTKQHVEIYLSHANALRDQNIVRCSVECRVEDLIHPANPPPSPRIDILLWLGMVWFAPQCVITPSAWTAIHEAHLQAAIPFIAVLVAADAAQYAAIKTKCASIRPVQDSLIAAAAEENRERREAEANMAASSSSASYASAFYAQFAAADALPLEDVTSAHHANGLSLIHCTCVHCGAHLFRRYYLLYADSDSNSDSPHTADVVSMRPSASALISSSSSHLTACRPARWCAACLLSHILLSDEEVQNDEPSSERDTVAMMIDPDDAIEEVREIHQSRLQSDAATLAATASATAAAAVASTAASSRPHRRSKRASSSVSSSCTIRAALPASSSPVTKKRRTSPAPHPPLRIRVRRLTCAYRFGGSKSSDSIEEEFQQFIRTTRTIHMCKLPPPQ
jgi:hypothetical protein